MSGSSGQIVQFGLVRAAPASVLVEEDRRDAQLTQAMPLVSSLAAHVRSAWVTARTAKQQTVEPRMLAAMRARRGEYSAEKLAQIREQTGGSEVYARLTSLKCRAAASWVRDVMLGTGDSRPWTIKPTPVPDLPPEIGEVIVQAAAKEIAVAEQSGMPLDDAQVVELLQSLKMQAAEKVAEIARNAATLMASKMEDQLQEGGFLEALDAFIDDIVTFPAAILKGPVIRRRPMLRWVQAQDGSWIPQVEDVLRPEWERVSPFDAYPSPQSKGVDDGYFIERIRYSPESLEAMVGVEGYDAASIRTVLDAYGSGGLREWLTNDVAQAAAEGRSTTAVSSNPDHLIDALQYWGTVQGKTLVDYGMDKESVPDPSKIYHVEVQLIGSYVIRAVLNYDPLHRKPYYRASYEEVPGSFWGNSVSDLVEDCQQIVNAAARSIVNNMALASGPQVGVNIDRLAENEDVTTLIPWRIWQTRSDMSGGSQPPLQFFQPQSNVQDLMAVFQQFSLLADEYSGIPKYMSGDARGGGAGRTASGLSMLMGNAGKAIKQVISTIDTSVLGPLIERLYNHNMRYSDDKDLKGDVQVVARGAASLIARETAQVRRNEFLAATANPVDMQIVGIEGRAALLRENAKGLDMDTDKVVPPLDQLRKKLAAQAMMVQGQSGSQAAPQASAGPSPSGQELQDGAPVTDNHSPPKGP